MIVFYLGTWSTGVGIWVTGLFLKLAVSMALFPVKSVLVLKWMDYNLVTLQLHKYLNYLLF